MDAMLSLTRKPNPVWPDMPEHVKQKCIDFTNALTKQSLRLCCKETKQLVSTASIHYLSLEIEIERQKITVVLELDDENSLKMEFRTFGTGCQMTNPAKEDWEKFSRNRGPVEEAMLLFTKYLAQPKASFEAIIIADGSLPFNSNFADFLRAHGRANQLHNQLERCLEGMQHQLLVEEIYAPSRALSKLIPVSKSKRLESLLTQKVGWNAPLQPLIALEQFKNLTYVHVDCPSDLSVDMLFGIKEWKLEIDRVTRIVVEQMIENCKTDYSWTVDSIVADREDIRRILANYEFRMDGEEKVYTRVNNSEGKVEKIEVRTAFLLFSSSVSVKKTIVRR